MQEHAESFERLNCRLVAVSFASPDRIEAYRRRIWPQLEILVDSRRELYAALGLVRGSLVRVFSPRTLARYAALALRGRLPQRPLEDLFQLGGNFLFDTSGNVRFAHRSRTPIDRPSVERLLEAVGRMDQPRGSGPLNR